MQHFAMEHHLKQETNHLYTNKRCSIAMLDYQSIPSKHMGLLSISTPKVYTGYISFGGEQTLTQHFGFG